MCLAAVVLAAGKGTRMKSDLPKVLHEVCGRPLLSYVLEAVEGAGAKKIVVVVGDEWEESVKALSLKVETVVQKERLGTAHALQQAQSLLEDFSGDVLVVCGDTPLLKPATLQALVRQHKAHNAAATILTARIDDPSGYGRVIRGPQGEVTRIVEHKDASPEELQVDEINTGVYCFRVEGLFEALAAISSDNVQGEYYLTDIVDIYVSRGLRVAAYTAHNILEALGINDRSQLARVEKIMRREIIERLMASGVTVMDPASTFIDEKVKIGQDTIIYPFTIIEGVTTIGKKCIIGPSSRLVNVCLGNEVQVQNSVVLGSNIGDGTAVGPFAYIRPGTEVGRGVRIGDFVEIKKSTVGNGSKVPHLTYLGDAVVGERVNVGAGTITCNYDGKRKWPTVIGDDAFVGSNTNLVAPVEVGKGAVIGAGSTITKDVPAGALGVERSRQKNVPEWKKKKRKNKK